MEEFLNDPVVRRRLWGSSQNHALNALVFLYAHVMNKPSIAVRSPLDGLNPILCGAGRER